MKDQDRNPPAPTPENEDAIVPAGRGEILLYQTEDGRTRVECRFQDETIWLSQALMAELYQKDVRTINEHLKTIYSEGELVPEATIRKFRIVRREGNREVARQIEHYNLDAILAVGYRVRSQRGIQFAERRRAFKEVQGEQDTMKALEDAAKNLPKRTKADDEGNGMASGTSSAGR